MSFHYETNCTIETDCAALTEMEELGRKVSYQTIRRRINEGDLLRFEEDNLYVRCRKGLKPKNDWSVKFYRSRFKGKRCYYIDHSRIFYIFTENKNND